jgi:hypothetical protein
MTLANDFAHHHVLIGSILVIYLCIAHYLSPQLKRITWITQGQLISFAAGVTAAYVFLHMLPELVESRDNLRNILNGHGWDQQMIDLFVYFLALMGFEVYYLLSYMGDRAKWREDGSVNTLFKYAIGFYFIYNFLITYTLLLRIETGVVYAILFSLAIGLHFILTDRQMRRTYPHLFTLQFRIILLIALVVGFLASLFFPMSAFITSLFIAFLSGAILCVSFTEQSAITKQTSLPSFVVGSLVMSVILALALIHAA